MTKHTPGPWVLMDTSTGALSINVTPRVPIATVGGMGWHLGEETARANARLIAAAPDMLAALRDIAAATTGDDSEAALAEIQGICARIISQATGGAA